MSEEIKCPEYGIVVKEVYGGRVGYVADILPDCDKPEIYIPEEVDGKKIGGLWCLQELPRAVRKIRLSRSVMHISAPYRKLGGRFLELEIDSENPYIFTDGKAVYTKKSHKLVRFVAGGCRSYEVLEGTREIAEDAFNNVPNLRHLKLPSGLEMIDNDAFRQMTALRDINIPDSVRVLGKRAFAGCKRLETLHIPKSVTEIKKGTFPTTGKFREITVDADNPNYTAENGVLFSKDKTRLIFAPPKVVGKRFAVPDFVTTIGSGAFSNMHDLEEVILPPSVSDIEAHAFGSCFSLRRINLENVKRIDFIAFERCTHLTSVELFCEELGECAFRGCHRLETIALNGLKICGDSPFRRSDYRELILPDDFDFTLLSDVFGCYGCYAQIITIRGHETREVLYKLGLCGSTECARETARKFSEDGFDFEGYDELVETRFDLKHLGSLSKIYTAYLRLKYPRGLSQHAREFYLSLLSELAEDALKMAVRDNNLAALSDCVDIGMINAGNILELIEHSIELHAVEFTARLLEIKRERFPDSEERLDLD